MIATIGLETSPRMEPDGAERLRQLPPEARSMVNAVMDAALDRAAQRSNSKFEQGFEFPWGHSGSFPFF